MIHREEVQQKADALVQELTALRRELHKHPELSNHEGRTSAILRERLETMGLELRTGLAVTGMAGLLRGSAPGRTVALRADMDGLPIQEKKQSPYRSEVPGVMHACGHDFHMTAVAGAAKVLSAFQDQIRGNVKFIFQPSEEKVSGAKRMIQADVLKNPDVSSIIGFHAFPLLPTGMVGIKYGVMMASANRFSIHLYGRPGHAAKPHLSVDTISIAAMVIQAIHFIVSSRIDPLHPAVVSVGMIRGGSTENVVCDHVELRGSIRATSNPVRDLIIEKIEKKVRGISEAMDGQYRFTVEEGSPPLDNHTEMTRLVETSAQEILGADRVQRLSEPSMGGEDFSCYIEEVPGTYFRIGTGNPAKDTCHYLHSDLFDVDEAALPEAVKVLCWSAIRYLNGSDVEESSH
jgi:amidohydrolase